MSGMRGMCGMRDDSCFKYVLHNWRVLMIHAQNMCRNSIIRGSLKRGTQPIGWFLEVLIRESESGFDLICRKEGVGDTWSQFKRVFGTRDLHEF